MYTRVGCEDSSAARDFLRERGVPFEEVDGHTFQFSVRSSEACSRTEIRAHRIHSEGRGEGVKVDGVENLGLAEWDGAP